MTHPWTRPPTSWPALADELVVALLRLPADRTLDLLAGGTALTITWLLPDRAVLTLPGRHAAALEPRGWSATRTCVRGDDRTSTARTAASAAVIVLRDVLHARPEAVELWWPCTTPPPLTAAHALREPLW